ncbi:MAG: DUF2723 domain-containing protein [Elusimicrobia bacterium]|nr:DUF2723 domain-containing protein [Candidatus Obscuribacterium magneticum]
MIAFSLFLLSFAYFLSGVSPTLYGGDAGELITSAFVLGLPHAPGFPLYNLLGKMASGLVPWGNTAYRINVMSALIASLALVATYSLLKQVLGIRHTGESRYPGDAKGVIPEWLNRGSIKLWIPAFAGMTNGWIPAFAGMTLGLSPVFVDQARAAEVFQLNFLFLVVILWGLVKAEGTVNGTGSRWFLWSSFLFGLGMGNHHILVVVAPLLIFAALRRRAGVRLGLGAFLFFLLGMTIYVYLPLRARAGPPVNFGDPETWSRFWAVLTRKEFGPLSLHPAAVPFRDLMVVKEDVFRFGGRMIRQIGFAGMGLAAMGLFLGWKRGRRGLVLASLYGLLIAGLGFELWSNLSPTSDIGQWRLERFLLIPLFSLVVLAAIGIKESAGSYWGRVVLMGFVVLFGIEAVMAQRLNLRDNFIYRDFAASALRAAPPASRLVIDRELFDEPTSSLLVTTQVEGKRNDIQFLYRPGTLFNQIYGKDVLELSWAERYRRQAAVEKEVLSSAPGPVRCLAFEKSHVPFPEPRIVGFLYRPRKEERSISEQAAGVDPFPFVVNRAGSKPLPFDYPRRLLWVHFPYLFGKNFMERADVGRAKRWFQSALAAGSDMAWLASNIGGIYAAAELLPEAERCFRQSVRLDPYYYMGHYGLGYVLLKEEKFNDAAAAYERAVKMNPEFPNSFYMLGVAYLMGGTPSLAREPWEKYLTLNPEGAQAGVVREELKKI